MSKLTDLIAAMREAGGAEPRLVSAWLELAQTNNVLRDALKQVFGRRFPTPQKFGGWLNENLGTKAGELTLLGQHSTHAKAWRYGVFIPADIAEAARAAAERKAARDAERDARLAKEAHRGARVVRALTAQVVRADARRLEGRAQIDGSAGHARAQERDLACFTRGLQSLG